MTTPELDPKSQAAQMAMIKLLGTPPEPILNLLERLQIPWERKTIKANKSDETGESFLVIKWSALMAGETRNQEEGPFIRKLVMELKDEFGPDAANLAMPKQVPNE